MTEPANIEVPPHKWVALPRGPETRETWMPDTYRFTFSVTPLSEADAQAVVDDIRARFGRAPLIHVVDKREAGSSVSDVQNAFVLEETIQALQNVIHEARQFVASHFPAEAPRPSALRETAQEMHEWASAHPAAERSTGAILGPEWARCLVDTETGRCDRVLVGGRCRIHDVLPVDHLSVRRRLAADVPSEEVLACGCPAQHVQDCGHQEGCTVGDGDTLEEL